MAVLLQAAGQIWPTDTTRYRAARSTATPTNTVAPNQWFRRKAFEAAVAAAVADQPVVPQRLARRGQDTQPEPPAQAQVESDGRPGYEVGGVKRHHPRHIPPAQRDGRGLDADLEVIVAVDHGVLGIVGQHPAQVAQQQRPGLRRHRGGQTGQRRIPPTQHGRKRHRDTKAERHAQHRLRHRHHALGIGIGQGHRQRRERQPDGGRIGGQHQRKGQCSQHRTHRQGLFHRQGAAGDRALCGALDVAVELAVGHIVGTAAGRAHQHRAQREHQHQVPARKAIGRDPQRAERGPQQQQPAGRAVPADQVKVQRQARLPFGAGARSAHARIIQPRLGHPSARHASAGAISHRPPGARHRARQFRPTRRPLAP